MIANGIPSGGLDPSYTRAFFPVAKRLEEEADTLFNAAAGGKDGRIRTSLLSHASDLYLRAAAVLRIARFPYVTAFPRISDADKWMAWTWQKKVYMKAAGRLWEEPVEEVHVPFAFGDAQKGDRLDNEGIPVYVRVPKSKGTAFVFANDEDKGKTKEKKKCPVVILMTGLDGYRPDNTVRCDEFLARGWAVVVVEIPGTADCPASSADPAAAERLWDSLLAWVAQDGRFDMARAMVWGLSCGGYYAVRIAHTHADKLRGVVAQGAGTHWFFDHKWLEKADWKEYPFQ